MQNYKACVEYQGTSYSGWQRQKGQLTIQEVIEEKLVEFLGHRVYIFGSGRTDAGVHAINQYFHFRTSRDLPDKAYVLGFNHYLPPDIRMKSVEKAPSKFHACNSAKKKTYVYKILNRKQQSALWRDFTWFLPYSLDIDIMNEAAALVTGEVDFSAFRASMCTRRNPVRTVDEAVWKRDGDIVSFTITANGFLHNMVRILVGTMAEVGMGRLSIDSFKAIHQSRDRRNASKTSPPQGLYLQDVYY